MYRTHSLSYIIALTIGPALGIVPPTRNIPTIGPAVQPMILYVIWIRVPPINSTMKPMAIASAPYTSAETTAIDSKFSNSLFAVP